MIQTEKQKNSGLEIEPDTFNVLVVEDVKLFAQAISMALEKNRIRCDLAFNAEEALAKCRNRSFQAILLDHRLPDDDGIRLIPVLLGRQNKCSVIVMTAYESIPDAIQAIRQGADDYVVKETDFQPIIDRIQEIRHLHQIRRIGEGWDEHRKEGLQGSSPGIVRVREQIKKVAKRADTTVLLTGETGVGKEVVARYLHKLSGTDNGKFVSVDCVALPSSLVESLLFGHEKGAFTGADRTKNGIFHEAGNGTILLDEIGDMDLSLQGKLLRVLENRSFQRVGSVREYSVVARIVAATNRDLGELVEKSSFRLDLFQRLSVFPIQIPPLRERGDDILILAKHFLDFFSQKMKIKIEPLSPEVQECLLSYNYPGNVRELKNIIERAVIITESGKVKLKHLPERMHYIKIGYNTSVDPVGYHSINFIPGIDTMKTLEEKLIRRSLIHTGGAKAEAAKLLGISRFQLLRRMQKYQMEPEGEDEN
ncbi:MAG: sigma-54-dependent Fis family transcriptional regulator [Deltaproteobacteria bacterium]|nr:sigma-54-dependent Fis family transcriptional regulator [Deltaproteobacteria bacterium]MBW1872911.1 sigma-54-dependent Fis family transcriptional regulator [Deltaproteobacteria bacterium]